MITFIQVLGLRAFCYHGLFDEERRLGQKFSFDIRARLRAAPSSGDDRLQASIRYDEVVETALAVATATKFYTLEALGEAIATRLLRQFSLIRSIAVIVSKTSPPIAATVERVSVEIRLSRAEFRISEAARVASG